ncbi:MAG TPA: DUF881 domain-containing protein [Micromonosporaceae bacterium]|nr:DUF881 domain-containing protein [Micromonosporaceae bacterium]
MEYGSGAASWREALRRAARVLLPRTSLRRRSGWSWGVPVIMAAAGLLFSASATTAQGTDLREDRRPRLIELIDKQEQRVADAEDRAARLRAEVGAQTDTLAGSDAPIAQQQQRAAAIRAEAGLTAVHGPGLTVRMDDAPRGADGTRPNGARPDDLVVHQQDVQAVVNALWAGGAEAMAIMDVRVISTSAVRCVGNTLLLHGRVYSPPFVVTAIGDPGALRRALDASKGVRLFLEAVQAFRLGYQVTVESDVTLPAYQGSVALGHARKPG